MDPIKEAMIRAEDRGDDAPLTTWDKTIAVHLRRIEGTAQEIETRSRWIADDAGALVNMPNWQTKAEESLVQTAAALTRTLNTIKQAQVLLNRKRIVRVAAE